MGLVAFRCGLVCHPDGSFHFKGPWPHMRLFACHLAVRVVIQRTSKGQQLKGKIPDLLFLAVLENKEKPTKTARIRSRGRTPKILEKQAKNAQKSRDFLGKKKARKSKAARKRRSGIVS